MTKNSTKYILQKYQEFIDLKDKLKDTDKPASYTKKDVPYLVLASIIQEAFSGHSQNSKEQRQHEVEQAAISRKHYVMTSKLGKARKGE